MDERSTRPTVSRILDDGTLIELLYDPAPKTTAFAVQPPTGDAYIAADYDLPDGERLVHYSPDNNLIATDCVLLPSALGVFTAKPSLLAEVRAFIGRYLDLPDEFAEVGAHYVLLTWVYDAFQELPYLRFQGEFGTGKTRALLTVGSLCYKPFFAAGASTVSPIFHVLEAFAGTLVLDEADFRFSDATADLTKILNNGTVSGFPVLRTMTNRRRELNPQAFRVFGPKIVGMRQGFADRALESRFITERMTSQLSASATPIHLPAEFHAEARELRNKLLAWRFAARATTRPHPERLVVGLGPRASQTVLSLVSLMDDPGLSQAVCLRVGLADERLREEIAPLVERAVLEATIGAFERGGSAGAPIGMITNFFNEDAPALIGRTVSPKWVGTFVRTAFGLQPVKAHGVYAIPHAERPRVDALAARFAKVEDGIAQDAKSTVSEFEPEA